MHLGIMHIKEKNNNRALMRTITGPLQFSSVIIPWCAARKMEKTREKARRVVVAGAGKKSVPGMMFGVGG